MGCISKGNCLMGFGLIRKYSEIKLDVHMSVPCAEIAITDKESY